MKKLIIKNKGLLLTVALICSMFFTSVPAFARTVYYHNTKVEWDYGRTMGLWGHSSVLTSHFTHSTSVNGSFSGWKRPGITASVEKYVGVGTFEAYWECK